MGMDCVDTLYQYRELHRTVGPRSQHFEAKCAAPKVDVFYLIIQYMFKQNTNKRKCRNYICMCLNVINFNFIKYICFEI